MGLKRRNPARTRLLTSPDVLAVLATSVAPRASERAKAETKPAPVEPRPAPKPAPRRLTREERHQMIAKVAYGHAERSGFSSDPVTNWLLAEREIDAELSRATS
jgi:hypothetical protein